MIGTNHIDLAHRQTKSFFRYWGKADPKYPDEPKWHLLAYHCLDVAAVAAAWWDASPVIRRTFVAAFGESGSSANRLRAWLLFFVALHDLGKLDVRFQLKALEALVAAWPDFESGNHGVSASEITKFDHGWAGIAWANQEYREWIGQDDTNRETWDAWMP